MRKRETGRVVDSDWARRVARGVHRRRLSMVLQAQEVANARRPACYCKLRDTEGASRLPVPSQYKRNQLQLAGTVKDSLGVAVRSRGDLVKRDNTVAVMTTTDSEGAFQFAGLSAGTYRVKIAAECLEPSSRSPSHSARARDANCL